MRDLSERTALTDLHYFVVNNGSAWPGCYPMVLIMADGESMCADCARENFRLIYRATRDHSRDGWAASGAEVAWEGEPDMCCNCNKPMPTAYGPVDTI